MKKFILTILSIFVLTTSAMLANAAPNGKKGVAGGPLFAPSFKVAGLAHMLDFTPDQSEGVLEVVIGAQSEAYGIAIQIIGGHKELRELKKAQRDGGEVDQEQVKVIRAQIKSLREDLKALVARVKDDINGILTPEQHSKLEERANKRKERGKKRKGRGRRGNQS